MKLWELIQEIQEEGREIPNFIKITNDDGTTYTDYIPDELYDYFVNLLNSKNIECSEKRQTPRDGQNCFCINQYGEVESYVWDDTDDGCLYAYAQHNCFKTEEEAKRYYEYQIALLKIQQPFSCGKDNFYIYYNNAHQCLNLAHGDITQIAGAKYLGTNGEAAASFMKEWKTEILEYEYDIKRRASL